MNFETVKRNYEKGLWTLALVKTAVRKGVITAEQFKEITGEEYVASNTPSTGTQDSNLSNKVATLEATVSSLQSDMQAINNAMEG